MTMIVMADNLATKITVSNLQIPSVGTMKLRKTLKHMGNISGKIVKKCIFNKMKLTSLLMKKRVSFLSKTCPVFVRSTRILRQYLTFHTFSVLATQLTGF